MNSGAADATNNTSSSTTTFLVPKFDESVPGKIHNDVKVKSPSLLTVGDHPTDSLYFGIASSGFPSTVNGRYIYVLRKLRSSPNVYVGFTDIATADSSTESASFSTDLSGTGLWCTSGCRRTRGWDRTYFPKGIDTREAQEIISILTISKNGAKKTIQWIVDGHEGPDDEDCTKDFGNGTEIFPCISAGEGPHWFEFISFENVDVPYDFDCDSYESTRRSPLIDWLLQEYSYAVPTQSLPSSPSCVLTVRQLQMELQKKDEQLQHCLNELNQLKQRLSVAQSNDDAKLNANDDSK